jgi:hypothetical protein
MENMPDRAQYLSDTPEEHTITINLCQCTGCGLVQLDNDPVWYWKEQIRTEYPSMKKRISLLTENMDFVSANYLEHVPCPNQYLAQFNGAGVIEVPNFDMILAKNLFSEIVLDHLMYFTKDTLRFALQYNGFDVIEIGSIWDNFILQALVERREPLKLLSFFSQAEKIKKSLDDYCSKFRRVAIYGASHEAFAYIAMLNPSIAFVVDDSPLKQNKYTPTGMLKIYSKEHLKYADAVVIMGAGYSDEILKSIEFSGSIAVLRDWGVEIIK